MSAERRSADLDGRCSRVARHRSMRGKICGLSVGAGHEVPTRRNEFAAVSQALLRMIGRRALTFSTPPRVGMQIRMREATMCNQCEKREIDRRSLLALAGFGIIAGGFGLEIRPATAAEAKKSALTPDQALTALKEGNARYVA